MDDDSGARSGLFLRMVSFFCKSILEIKKDHGDEVFEYLFYDRTPNKSKIENAILNGKNVTLVGDPGQGKTTLMHSLFTKFRHDDGVFAIILDYREVTPHDIRFLIIKFINEMKIYFSQVGRDIQITDETSTSNYEDHFFAVANHLQSIRKEHLSKKLVIFLDDLDYAEEDYWVLLKKYFASFAYSDKVVLILSCRPPLLNNIRQDDQLIQYYLIQPQEEDIVKVDLKALIYSRLKALLKGSSDRPNVPWFIKFAKTSKTDRMLIQLARRNAKIDNEELTDSDLEEIIDDLPFDESFYSNLYDIAHGNLRDIEEILPYLLEWELNNKEPSLNNDFLHAFVDICVAKNKNHLLLNFTEDRTSGPKTTQKGNLILQIVLEYFYFHELLDDYFYETMLKYGIQSEAADRAIEKLTKPPYNVIDPQYIYCINSKTVVTRRYLINNKGRKYVEDVLKAHAYYEKLSAERSARSLYDELLSAKNV